MDADLSRILAVATSEEMSGESRDEEARELLGALTQQNVPTGRLARLWSMGSLQTRLALSYALVWLRERFATAEEKETLRDEAHLQAAARLLAGMGYLRGAALKVGQVMASYPDVVPQQYVEALSALHAEAPPMHFSLLREQVRAELGDDPEALFEEFDSEAFAAASLGQVHRARLKSGERVAVKIQYPNIARTIDADLDNLKLLLQPLRLLKDWGNKMDVLEDIRQTLVAETDYRRELESAERVREALADMPDVVIPRMFPELSSERVITMEYLDGRHMAAFLETAPSQELRDRHGLQLLRSGYRLWASARLIHSDQNPGNYLFLEDGRLGLLDFGCIRPMNDDEWQAMVLSVDATRGGDEELQRALRKTNMMSDAELGDPERLGHLKAICDWLWEPVRTDEPFDFSDGAYLKHGCELIVETAKRRYTRTMPVITWMNRMLLGVRALFTQLGARIPYKQVNDEELERAGL